MSENVREKNFPLPPEKARALSALMLSGDNEHAAKAANVNERTIRRWREEPEFQDALQVAIDAALEAFSMVLASAVSPAVLKIRLFSQGIGATPAQQLRASIALADMGLRAQELTIRRADLAMRQAEHEEFERRLAALEEVARAKSR